MLLSFTLLVLVPAIYLFYNQTQATSINILYAEVDKIGKTVLNSARQIYFLGKDAKVTLELTVPENIRRIYVLNNSQYPELVIEFQTQKGREEFVFTTTQITQLTANYSYVAGSVTGYALSDNDLRGGLLMINVESRGDYVFLSLV